MLIHSRLKAGALGVLLLFAAAGAAADDDRPGVIQALQAQGLEHIQEFDAGEHLRGFAGLAGQDPVAVYVTPDGQAIVGKRLDERGVSLDERTVEALVAGPISQAVWDQLENASWVADGDARAPRVVYAFMDPNCPYCHRFWAQARPWVEAGKVQLRHVVVGVIRPDSRSKAAAILGAEDPTAALLENENRFDQDGIEPAARVSRKISRQLKDNQKLMREMGFRGTPGILYSDGDGGIQAMYGMPPEDALADILGPL